MSIATVLLATLVIGCGSSGPTIQKTAISGFAVDDLIIDGDVVVYPAGNPSNILERGKTDHFNGAYRLNVGYDGVVVVEVTCGTEGKMKNPATGAIKSCEQDLALHSAAAVTPTSGSVKVNVSPLTEAVVQRMETLGESGVTPEHLESATDDIKGMFGVDPIEDNPIEGDYSGIVSSFHALAESTDKSITDVINEIAEDLKDGEAGDDSNLTQGLAQEMQEQNLTNGIADNNGTFNPAINALTFTSEELVNHTFYAVEEVDYGRLDFNATKMKWTNMFDHSEYDVSAYTINGSKLRFSDGSEVERIVKTANYSVIKPINEDKNIYMYATEDAAKAKIRQISANFGQEVQDSQTDSAKSHAGFELTSFKTTVNDGDLVIEVKTKGDIKDALDTVTTTPNYANILWISINNYYEFGLMANDQSYMQKNIRTDGEFQGETNGTVAGYSYHLLLDNKGVELRVPLTSLERIEDVLNSALIVKAEVAEDDTTVNAEGEENDENSYDTIETFVTLKTIPVTAEMFANKTFYSRWMEQNGPVYEKLQTTTTDINSTEQNGNDITVTNGTYTIADGKVSVVMDGTTVLSVLDVNADHVVIMYEEDSGDKGIDTWYFSKPQGFPSFVQGDGANNAPTISLRYPPTTLAGIPLKMNMVDFNDSDGDSMTMGVVSLPANGTLQINGADATVGETVALSALQSVEYIPTSDFNGTVTSEINVTDGTDTTTLPINILVLDKNNTIALTTEMLNNKTFYIMDDEGAGKLDFNATHATFTTVTSRESFPYSIVDGKKLVAGDMEAYLLRDVNLPNKKLWKLGAEYDNGDKMIEAWFITKPADFPF